MGKIIVMFQTTNQQEFGVSEHSVPLNSMVNDHYPIKWLFHWEYTLFSDKPNLAGCINPTLVKSH